MFGKKVGGALKLRLKVETYLNKLKSWPPTMIILSQTYFMLKKETGAEFARKVLLENLKQNKGNVKKTAKEMGCSRNTIYLALKKEKEGDLLDKSHTPKSFHPKNTKKEIVDLIVKRRKETGFGKRRLRWYMAQKDNILIPESTIGKILKEKKLTRKKKRVRREYHLVKYHLERILPFENLEVDTKEILDKRTLPKEVYEYLLRSDFIPKYQWTVIEPVTRIRFLAWSYSKDWSCGQVFLKMVVWWLRVFGFKKKIILWSDGGTEFQASMRGAFEKANEYFFEPLGIERRIIRKGHPEDNSFVERSHQTDDFEFYIPHLLKVKSELDFIRLGAWWQKVYNLVRPHMELKNLTPYEKLKSLGYATPQEFCFFPNLILDRLVNLPEILNHPKSVQNHLDYDQIY
jgi:transposase